MVPIIIVKSRFYFGIRNCRHEVTNRMLANNRIVKAVTLPKVYLNLLLVASAKISTTSRKTGYLTEICDVFHNNVLSSR
jgi:hypothetical protein